MTASTTNRSEIDYAEIDAVRGDAPLMAKILNLANSS